VSYCGDHKYPKLTSKITEQEAGSSRYRKSSKRQTLTESNHFHASMALAGNVLFLSKSNPMPNTRINPYVDIDLATGTLLESPQFKDILAKLQDMLTRTNNNAVEDFDQLDPELDKALEIESDDTTEEEDGGEEEVLEAFAGGEDGEVE
jgi:hypothetical protein